MSANIVSYENYFRYWHPIFKHFLKYIFKVSKFQPPTGLYFIPPAFIVLKPHVLLEVALCPLSLHISYVSHFLCLLAFAKCQPFPYIYVVHFLSCRMLFFTVPKIFSSISQILVHFQYFQLCPKISIAVCMFSHLNHFNWYFVLLPS